MRPNVPLEPAVRPDMGRLDCKVASGGQMEAGIHRWEGGHLVTCWFTQTTASLSMSMSQAVTWTPLNV